MRKETAIKVLSNSCFLLPGNIKSSKAWFLSILSVLSLIGLLIAIWSCICEYFERQHFMEKVTPDKFQFICFRGAADCLKSENPVADGGATSQFGGSNASGNGRGEMMPPPPPGSHLMEEIVNTAYRILIYVVNISIRIFTWITFPQMTKLFSSVFLGHESQTEFHHSFMRHLWYESVQPWSAGEKVFLAVVFVSQLQRELELVIEYSLCFHRVGLSPFNVPCALLHVLQEQAKIFFSRELILEVATFILLVIIRVFVNVLRTVAGPDPDHEEGESDSSTDSQRKSFGSGDNNDGPAGNDTSRNRNHHHVSSQLFLVKAQAQSSLINNVGRTQHASFDKNLIIPNATVDSRATSLFGGGGQRCHPGLSVIFRASQQQKAWSKARTETDKAETIYSQINFIISMYFELMAVWERTSKLVGFVTLLLFLELTISFCLNTYMTLDSTMRFGLVSAFGACGVMRGIVIVFKLICVCNAAQALEDMTQVLIDRILKLKLQLLSLPKELYRKSSAKSGESVNGSSAFMCDRCRGLGSFLTEVITYIRNHPFQLSALGYFSVSRSSLTTITGVIVTYLVVLVQFQSYSTSSTNVAAKQ